MECGVSNFVFKQQQRGIAAEWAKLGRFKALFTSGSHIVDGEENSEVAKVHSVGGPDDLKRLERALLGLAGSGSDGQGGLQAAADVGGLGAIAIMDASDWKVIPAAHKVRPACSGPTSPTSFHPACLPAENLVAMAQRAKVRLFATADTAKEAEVMLGALEHQSKLTAAGPEKHSDLYFPAPLVLQGYLALAVFVNEGAAALPSQSHAVAVGNTLTILFAVTAFHFHLNKNLVTACTLLDGRETQAFSPHILNLHLQVLHSSILCHTQIGVHGVLLRTNNAADVRALAKAMEAMQLAATPPLHLERATVTHVTPTGMGVFRPAQETFREKSSGLPEMSLKTLGFEKLKKSPAGFFLAQPPLPRQHEPAPSKSSKVNLKSGLGSCSFHSAD
eukprot:1159885-Pelagomonas_calceolata.AAC.2